MFLLLLDVIIVKLVHEKFGELEYGKTHVEWFVDKDLDFTKLDPCNLIGEDPIRHAVGFVCQSASFLVVGDQLYVRPLFHIFAGFSVNAVIHQFEEIFFKIVGGLGSEILIEVDVLREPLFLMKSDDPMDLC